MAPRRYRFFTPLFLIQSLTLNFHLSLGFYPTTVTRHRTTVLSLSEKPDEENGVGVGIDLGTTNSAVAFLDGNVPRIIEIPNNGRTMKSVVAFDDEGQPLVGNDAIEWERRENMSAYRHVKRVIGTGANFISRETAAVVPHVVAAARSSPGGKKKYKKKPSLQRLLDDAEENPTTLYSLKKKDGKFEKVSPETISSAILRNLLDVASEHTKKKITRAVIGIPAYFNDAQRDATVRAANEAGVEKVKLLREPEAAALTYGVDKGDEEELVLVCDLGGGTYDVSILLVEKGLTEIVCTSGNAQLGGSDFDARIAKRLAVLSGNCCTSKVCSDTLIRAAESIRIYLSNNRRVDLALPLTEDGWIALEDSREVIVSKYDEAIEEGTSNYTHTFVRWTRKDMEKLCIDELQQLLRPIREVAIMAGALLPGDARPSVVESAIEMENAFADTEKFYDDDDDDDDVGVTSPNADAAEEAIPEELDVKAAKKLQQKGRKKARQVAKQERKFRAESRKANEAEPESQGRVDGITGRPIARLVLVGGATRMPAIGRILSALTGVVPQKTVDPDEAVALGCAVHVGVLDGKEEMGTVLNPMQAALLRAIVEKQRRDGQLDDMFDGEDDFETMEMF